jgi:hypothetical protein
LRWSYKTEHFSLKKDGLLGSAFIDEVEIELSLNEYGHAGWELVSLMEVNDGLIAVFKQPLSQGIASIDSSVLEEQEEALETQPVTEQEASVLTDADDSTAQPEPEKEALEEADSSEADVGAIRIF